MVHPVAYQLIVTHRGNRSDPGASAKWVGIQQSKVQRRKTQGK